MRAFETVTVTSGVHQLSPPARYRRALIHVVGAPIRWLAIPGSSPSGSEGFSVPDGGWIDWTECADAWGLIHNASFTLDAAALNNATLEVGYFL